MFGFKKKTNVGTIETPQAEFLEEPSHRLEVSLPGRSRGAELKREKQEAKVYKPQYKSKAPQARYLYSHVNHLTGKTHTVAEIAEQLEVSKTTVYGYLKDVPKKKKRGYNVK